MTDPADFALMLLTNKSTAREALKFWEDTGKALRDLIDRSEGNCENDVFTFKRQASASTKVVTR
jgi:hypothetical protein